MVQILPQINYIGKKQEGFGGFLEGLGSGLQKLAEGKSKEIHRKKSQLMYQQAGYTPEAAQILAHFEETQPQNLPKYLGMIGQGDMQQQSQSAGEQGLPYVDRSEGQQQKSPLFSGKQQAAAIKDIKKEEADRFKATKDYRQSVLSAKKASRADIKDLNRLEELSKSGKLDTPGYIEFLKNSGLDIPALMNPESEEFQKIQANFLRGAKQYFGGRISNYEVEQFLKTIPSLSQSSEGRSRVLANLKYITRGADEYYKAYEDVLKEHKGIPPYDIEEKVERKIDSRMDKIYDQFKKEVSKPVPRAQNKLVTALQSAAGTALGNIGKGAAGAVGGAFAGGRTFGPAGVVPGAAIGGVAGLSGFGLKSFL